MTVFDTNTTAEEVREVSKQTIIIHRLLGGPIALQTYQR